MKNLAIDLRDSKPNIKTETIRCGTKKSVDRSIDVNSLYFTFDDKIVLPTMGEFHFSRLNHKYWEESILKLKACGVNIIATYVFWIHHEEVEGEFDWSLDRNLRAFLELCEKHDMKVLVRVGPWAHGEARNGGFPDWLVKALPKPLLRSNNEYYLGKVDTYLREVYKQVEGKLFKDGGCVIAVQVENEYKGSREHLMKLKEMIINIGFDVPFYTATAWSSRGYSDIPDGEMIPAFGGYPDAPWASHIEKLNRKEQYIFTEVKNDEVIGSDLHEEDMIVRKIDTSLYPYITCELGTGVQATKHRRPKIEADDVLAMAYVKIGSGLNLIGYYMFHGGTNPYGKLSYLNETKDTGYPNDLPKMTYDFQAAIGEYGLLSKSYKGYKLLGTMLNEFGDRIANTKTIMPKEEEAVRYSVRVNNESGFIFVNNYQRYASLEKIEDVSFDLNLINDTKLTVPYKPMTVPANEYFVMPFNFDLSGTNLIYSTAQPICKVNKNGIDTYFFFAPKGVNAEYAFGKEVEIKSEIGNIVSLQDKNVLEVIEGSINSSFTVGNNIKVVTLNKEEALNLWKFNLRGEEEVVISNHTVLSDGENIRITYNDTKESIRVFQNENINNEELTLINNEGDFKEYKLNSELVNAESITINELQLEGEYSLEVPVEYVENNKEVILTIEYSGESAELYSKDKLIADNYYIDGVWKISLKHVKRYLACGELTLKINPLKEGDLLYIEKWPELKNGYVSELVQAYIEKEDTIIL